MFRRLDVAGYHLRGVWLGLCLLWVGTVWAQEVVLQLRNGDRLSGTITLEDTNRVVLKTRWGEALTIPVGQILKREIVAPPGEVAPTNLPPPAVTNVAPPAVTNVAPPAVTNAAPATVTNAAPATVTNVPPPAAPEPPPPPPAAPVKPKPPQRWFGDFQLGTTVIFSEKDQQLYTGRFKLTYAKNKFRNIFDYLFAYGRTDGNVSANRMSGSIKTDFDFHDKLYVYNQGGAGYDEIRLIDIAYDVGPGLGYRILKRPSFALNAEAGVNYQVQHRADDTRTESFYFRLGEDATWKLSSRFTVDEKFEFFPEARNWRRYRFRFESNLHYLLGSHVALTLTVIDEYDTNPATQVNPNDVQLRSSVGIKF